MNKQETTNYYFNVIVPQATDVFGKDVFPSLKWFIKNGYIILYNRIVYRFGNLNNFCTENNLTTWRKFLLSKECITAEYKKLIPKIQKEYETEYFPPRGWFVKKGCIILYNRILSCFSTIDNFCTENNLKYWK